MDSQNVDEQTPVMNVEDESVNEGVIGEENVGEKKGSRAPRSWVWDHFTYEKGASEVQCPYCKHFLAGNSKKNGTGSLINHLKNVCKTSPVYKKPDLKKQATLNFKAGAGLVNHSFSQEKCRMLVARMCIKDNRPFSVVDDEGFKELMWGVNPSFKLPSRWTVAKDCISIYKEEASNLKDLLKNQTVSLTTDTWTSVQNYNYMCLTAHWVDDSWVLRKKILNFRKISNHKGRTIGKIVYGCLKNWGIDRVLTVTVDNASSNDVAINSLELEELIENLEKIEADEFPAVEKLYDESFMDDDWD